MKTVKQQEKKLQAIELAMAKKEQELLELSQKWRQEKEALDTIRRVLLGRAQRLA